MLHPVAGQPIDDFNTSHAVESSGVLAFSFHGLNNFCVSERLLSPQFGSAIATDEFVHRQNAGPFTVALLRLS
jgi:hypothetical protein